MRRLLARIRADRRGGSEVAALCVVVPAGFGVVLMWMFFARQGIAVEGVTHAAAVAARAASMERSPGDAHAAAQTAAAATLAEAGTSCVGGPSVEVSASEWAAGGIVTVTVTCQSAGIGALDATARTFSSSAHATIDAYRGFTER